MTFSCPGYHCVTSYLQREMLYTSHMATLHSNNLIPGIKEELAPSGQGIWVEK